MKLEEIHATAFDMIGLIGPARSDVLNSLDKLITKKIEKEEALEIIQKSMDLINEAGQHHLKLIQHEAQGKTLENSILLVHAEDLYLTTSTMLEMLIRLVKLI